MRPSCRVDVIHHISCRHQIEIEVWPPRIDLYFADERMRVDHKGALVEREIDLIDAQARFEATVINSDRGVRWQVFDAGGGPGAGSIDATGLYLAPAKGAWKSGQTDVVVATSVEDPLRKAYAWVTLFGDGPLKAPQPRIEIWPKRVDLYYYEASAEVHNNFIDDSNKVQLFQARTWHSDTQDATWKIISGPGAIDYSTGLYVAPHSGNNHQVVVVRGYIAATAIYDEARIVLRDYVWPGLN